MVLPGLVELGLDFGHLVHGPSLVLGDCFAALMQLLLPLPGGMLLPVNQLLLLGLLGGLGGSLFSVQCPPPSWPRTG